MSESGEKPAGHPTSAGASSISSSGQLENLALGGDSNARRQPVMSRAARRRAKKPQIVVTPQMREEARERLRELRKYHRLLKSNGARRKLAKLRAQKRTRETKMVDEVCSRLDVDARPLKKTRRE
uniref:Uncharacterized protein n=1 Tax=Trypanosoma congolense (strain IL3000) TaxID=1068625 RepID=G0UJK6_TRYCI|nr:conserved hypothetical protein [Trypanosoma congolense IL3000]